MKRVDDSGKVIPPKKRLRTGFTTGACATAATRGALEALLGQKKVDEVEIGLPIGKRVKFKLHLCEFESNHAKASVIKDAGDDPDCTHGAELVSDVYWSEQPGVVLQGGLGVGKITKPGLGLEVGGPAINPVPRQMLHQTVEEVLGPKLRECGVRVVISVPQGEEMAKKTLNDRLGILGGISILGTTGIVKPYSTAAFRASVEQAIDVAKAQGCAEVVLTTGGRSEEFAQKVLNLPAVAFVQMGDFVGVALKYAVKIGLRKVTLAGMVGKVSKLANGKLQTHAGGSEVNMDLLSQIAGEAGAGEKVQAEIRAGNTARQAQEIVLREKLERFFDLLAQKASQVTHKAVEGKIDVENIVFDFDGKVLGRSALPTKKGRS